MAKRKLEFYILNIEPNENANIYNVRFTNSLISYDNNKYYFNSRFKTNKEEIDYFFRKLEIGTDLLSDVEQILQFSYNEAKTISEENMGIELIKGNVLGGIKDVLNRFGFYGAGEKDIFDLFTDIFIRMLMGHYLNNGNKRLALTFLKGILWQFGYYLKWTDGMWKDWSTHKTVIEIFVSDLEGKTEDEKVQIRLRIKAWIMNNVIIGLNWRRV